jgi:hypothetical protein
VIPLPFRPFRPYTIDVGYPKFVELIFEIRYAEEGGFCARALDYAIFTEAETWDELRANILEAVAVHFEDITARLGSHKGTASETS